MSELIAAIPRPRRRGFSTAVLSICAALVVLGATSQGPGDAGLALAVVLALSLLAIGYRAPGAAIATIVILTPIQLAVSSALFHLGLPGSAAHALGNVKDVLLVSIVLRAVNLGDQRRTDLMDRLIVGYVALLTVYLLLPMVAPGVIGSSGFQARLTDWRTLIEPAVLCIAIRRLPFSDSAVRRLLRALVVLAAVLGGCAIYESISPTSWNDFMVSVLGVPAYKREVIGLTVNAHSVITHTVVGGHPFVRSGSLFANSLSLGFALYCELAIALAWFARRRGAGAGWAAILVFGGIAMTITRSAILGAAVIALVMVLLTVRGRYPARARLALTLLAAAIVLAPIAGSTSVGARTLAAIQGTDVSAQQHVSHVQQGFDLLVAHPFGLGLATGPGAGARFDVATVTAEDFYLGLGDEIGVLGMLAFVALYIALMVRLLRASRRTTRFRWLAGSLYAAGWGYAVGGLFLHVFLDTTSSLTFFALSGLALALDRQQPVAGVDETEEA